MIGFKTEFGLRKENGRIALTLAKTSRGQPKVTRLILNPVVKDLLDSLARPGGLSSYSPTLEGTGFCRPTSTGFGISLNISLSATDHQGNASLNLPMVGQFQGSRTLELLGCNPVPPGFRSRRGVFGSEFSGSV